MKDRIIRIVFWSILFVICLLSGIYGLILSEGTRESKQKLETITSYFNDSIIIKNNTDPDLLIKASLLNSTTININYINETIAKTYEYNYDNGILTSSFDVEDTYGKEVLKIMLASVAESLSKSYSDIVLQFDNLDLESYTINKGLTYTITNNTVLARINTNTELIIDTQEDTYITENDLIPDALTLKNGTYTKSKNNLILTKSGTETTIISVLETPTLTENAYNSIISVLNTIYENKEITDYFKSNFNSIYIGNTSFDGIKIQVNPDMNEKEILAFGDNNSNFVRVTIIRNQINLTSSNTNIE